MAVVADDFLVVELPLCVVFDGPEPDAPVVAAALPPLVAAAEPPDVAAADDLSVMVAEAEPVEEAVSFDVSDAEVEAESDSDSLGLSCLPNIRPPTLSNDGCHGIAAAMVVKRRRVETSCERLKALIVVDCRLKETKSKQRELCCWGPTSALRSYNVFYPKGFSRSDL